LHPMTFDEITRRLAEYDREAGMFIDQILQTAALWDDLIDRDKPVADGSINKAFEIMLINLPRNKFYTAHFNELNPVLIVSIQNWHMANHIEREMRQELFGISFIIRSTYVDLITLTAFILGGHTLAQELGMAARLFVHDEGMHGYVQDLAQEKLNREGV